MWRNNFVNWYARAYLICTLSSSKRPKLHVPIGSNCGGFTMPLTSRLHKRSERMLTRMSRIDLRSSTETPNLGPRKGPVMVKCSIESSIERSFDVPSVVNSAVKTSWRIGLAQCTSMGGLRQLRLSSQFCFANSSWNYTYTLTQEVYFLAHILAPAV